MVGHFLGERMWLLPEHVRVACLFSFFLECFLLGYDKRGKWVRADWLAGLMFGDRGRRVGKIGRREFVSSLKGVWRSGVCSNSALGE